MPKKETILRYKDMATPAVATRSSVVSSISADHGSLSGLGDDDHPQYAAIAQDETVSGDWTFSGTIDLSGATVSLDCAAPDADSVNVAASGEGTNTTYARSDHTHNLDEGIAPTWTAGHTFQATMSTYDVLPGATDTYDLGSSTYWFSQMFVSQINAAVFAEEQIALLGGWLYVSHDAGTFAAEVGAADATIDFGKAMTVSDFVVVKAPDKSGTIKTEYIQVGALSAGTVYNVTRDLAAAHAPDPNWAAGTPFAVLGQTGDGRIELNAYDAPRIQIIVQDDAVTYSNTTEYLRLGDMNGAFGSDAANEYGMGVGDYSGGNYLTYNTTDGFELKAGAGAVRLDATGVRLLETGTSTSYVSWKETDFSGDTISYFTTTWDGGADDDIKFWAYSYKATGMSAGDAIMYFGAYDVDAGREVRFAANSAGWTGSVYPFYSGDFVALNAFMTRGITINQGANDDEAFAIKSYDDVAHGMTDFAETDTYFTISKQAATAGGAALFGYRDADGGAYAALQLGGRLGEAADTTKTTGGYGVVHITSQVKSGTGCANVGADGNLVSIANGATTRYIFDAEGSAHADVEWTTFDEADDVGLLDGLESAMAAWQGEDGVRGAFGRWLGEHEHELERLGLVHFDRENPGHAMVNTTRMMMLLTGAVRQLGERLSAAERKLLTV